MSAPEEYFIELREEILNARSEEELNLLLDEWYDARYRATDYDAYKWGFDVKTWCSELRKEMEIRIARARASRGPYRGISRGSRG